MFAGLLICSAATVELTRRVGENLGFVKDVYAVWELPVAMLLPLAYVPVLPADPLRPDPVAGTARPAYRRVFSAAAIGLSYVTAALVFRVLIHVVPGAGLKIRLAMRWPGCRSWPSARPCSGSSTRPWS